MRTNSSSPTETPRCAGTAVWATDGSELADDALEQVRELALHHDSRIVAVHANELMRGRSSGYPAVADELELERKIGKQVEELRSAGADARFVIETGNRDVAHTSGRPALVVPPWQRARRTAAEKPLAAV